MTFRKMKAKNILLYLQNEVPIELKFAEKELFQRFSITLFHEHNFFCILQTVTRQTRLFSCRYSPCYMKTWMIPAAVIKPVKTVEFSIFAPSSCENFCWSSCSCSLYTFSDFPFTLWNITSLLCGGADLTDIFLSVLICSRAVQCGSRSVLSGLGHANESSGPVPSTVPCEVECHCSIDQAAQRTDHSGQNHATFLLFTGLISDFGTDGNVCTLLWCSNCNSVDGHAGLLTNFEALHVIKENLRRQRGRKKSSQQQIALESSVCIAFSALRHVSRSWSIWKQPLVWTKHKKVYKKLTQGWSNSH